MRIPEEFLANPTHKALVEDLVSLPTAEDRLSWLMERQYQHRPLALSERTDDCKVPGCLSGLWLKAHVQGDICGFAAHSDSDLVHGVVSFLCDLYSDRSCGEILSIGDLLSGALGLEGLLSTTRKRAVSSALAFFRHTATANLGERRVA